MPGHGVPEGAISREDIAELAPLFEYALDPLSLSAKEAASQFGPEIGASASGTARSGSAVVTRRAGGRRSDSGARRAKTSGSSPLAPCLAGEFGKDRQSQRHFQRHVRFVQSEYRPLSHRARECGKGVLPKCLFGPIWWGEADEPHFSNKIMAHEYARPTKLDLGNTPTKTRPHELPLPTAFGCGSLRLMQPLRERLGRTLSDG